MRSVSRGPRSSQSWEPCCWHLDNLSLLVGLLSLTLLSHVLSYAEILWVLLDYGCFSIEGIQIWWALVLAPDLNSIIPHIFRIQREVCGEKVIYSLKKAVCGESTTNCMGTKLYWEFSIWPTLVYRVLLPHLLCLSVCHHDTGLCRWCSIY